MAQQIKQESISSHKRTQAIRELTENAVQSAVSREGKDMSPFKSELIKSEQAISQSKTNLSYSGLKDIAEIHDLTDKIADSREAQYRKALAEGNTGAEALYDAYSSVSQGFNSQISGIQRKEKFNKILTLSNIDDQIDYETKLLQPEDYGKGIQKYITEHGGGQGLDEHVKYHIQSSGIVGNAGMILGGITGAAAGVMGFIGGGPAGAAAGVAAGAAVGRGLDELTDVYTNAIAGSHEASLINIEEFMKSETAKELVEGGMDSEMVKKAIIATNKQTAKQISEKVSDETWGYKWFNDRTVHEKDFAGSKKKYFG